MEPFKYNVAIQILFLVVCLYLFLFQTYNSFLEYLRYGTATTTAYKDISQITFPRIMLCYGGNFWSQKGIEASGYEDFKDFVIGRNKIQNGWKAGEDSVKNLFDKVYQKPSLKEYLREDSFLKVNGSLRQSLDWIESPMNYQGGLCLKLNLDKSNFSLNSIILKFKDFENITNGAPFKYIYITITDPYRETFRTESLSHSGDVIRLHFDEYQQKTFNTYQVSVRETQELEEDQESLCREYQNHQNKEIYKSYRKCTLDKLREEYFYHFNCLPPWFTQKYERVCQGPLNSTEIDIFDELIYKHLDTAEFDGCKQPCTRLDITSRKIRYISPYAYNGIKINFNPTVEITKSVLIYTELYLFSNIGGFLGLCLGISLLDGHRVVSRVVMELLKLNGKKQSNRHKKIDT